jgi:hypothetical protein
MKIIFIILFIIQTCNLNAQDIKLLYDQPLISIQLKEITVEDSKLPSLNNLSNPDSLRLQNWIFQSEKPELNNLDFNLNGTCFVMNYFYLNSCFSISIEHPFELDFAKPHADSMNLNTIDWQALYYDDLGEMWIKVSWRLKI